MASVIHSRALWSFLRQWTSFQYSILFCVVLASIMFNSSYEELVTSGPEREFLGPALAAKSLGHESDTSTKPV